MDDRDYGSLGAVASSMVALDGDTFDAWLSDPYDPHSTSPISPSQRLASMVKAPCMTQHGRMAIMDAMLAAQIKNAVAGDTAAFKLLYNELEHGGVQKTANLNMTVMADFTDEINSILAASGLSGTPEGIVEGELNLDAPEKPADAPNDISAPTAAKTTQVTPDVDLDALQAMFDKHS